jgi:hypothetical protein
VSETSITQSVEQATENSVTDTTTHGWEAGIEVGVDFIAESKITAKYTGEISTEAMKSRSTSNTYETASTKSIEITEEISVTVGDHEEPAGLNRYSLFTTTDVYYVLITDQTKTTVKKAYTALCARPTTYWALDYEPELGGSFRKTASGDLLKIPNLVLSSLPTPTDNDLTPIPAQKAATPVADKTAGSYQTSVTVTLSSATAGAAIRYTTNGDTPTASSALYNGPITINQSCTLRAIAIAAGMENSTLMTEAYTITEVPLQTSWKITLSSKKTITDTQTWVDIVYIPGHATVYHNYDVDKLKTAGYAYIQMAGSFTGREIYDAWLWLDIKKGADGKGTTWYSYHDYDLAPGVSGFQTMTIPKTGSPILIPLNDFDLNFQMIWDASGQDEDDWELGDRTLTFTAVKN